MTELHFTNAFFERELMMPSPSKNPFALLEMHPLFLQLQYLSCLTVEKEMSALVSDIPDEGYLERIKRLNFCKKQLAIPSTSFPKETKIHSWGASQSLAYLAKQKKYLYEIPSLEVVQTVHSKAFAFKEGQALPNAALLETQEDLCSWWSSFEGAKVLKALYGSSGRGHFISEGSKQDLTRALSFLEKNKKVLAEPWMTRILDFSTQWLIEKGGSYTYLGATICQNSSKGTYQKSITGPNAILFKDHLPFLQEHLFFAQKMVEKIRSLSFFGHIGFDAMVYEEPLTKKVLLHPILEVNARKTMGWICLKLQQKLSPNTLFSLAYGPTKSENNLLPDFLIFKERKIAFDRQLFFEIHS